MNVVGSNRAGTVRGWWQKPGLLLPALLVLQALALALNPHGMARAEGFSDSAFQKQWAQTDQAVANGTASRTYFWGPQGFAHTKEVYAESPFNGQREVQYFDKARMELTRKEGQPDDSVTNGLLTVELVTGQLQVGDTKFLQRTPATNPVAGDQVGNIFTPTYASFYRGKLAFGVPGAANSSDRTGEAIKAAVNVQGGLAILEQTPVNLKNARYFAETSHNVADVFNNFFQKAPLGEDKWLAVMGYPITEAYWARDQVVVGGQKKDVLIQLFQRRALTYTPSNPAGFQVEMGNIGQHYYVWRNGFDTRDQLPGNDRLILPQGTSLYSVNTRKPADKVKLGDAPTTISGVWALNEGRAVVKAGVKLYLVDLTRVRAFKEMPLPASNVIELGNLNVNKVAGSPDGRKIAVNVSSLGSGKNVTQIYNLDTLEGDNLNIMSNTTAFLLDSGGQKTLAFSGDNHYLALGREIQGLRVYDLFEQKVNEFPTLGAAYWLGKSPELLVTTSSSYSGNPSPAYFPGKIYQVNAATNVITTLAEGLNIREAIPSPDGNYFAVRQSENNYQPSNGSSLIKSFLTFRTLTEPSKELYPAYVQGTSGRTSNEPSLVGWNADGTFIQIGSSASLTAGADTSDYSFVSLVNGKDLKKVNIPSNYNSYNYFKLAASLYTLKSLHTYNGPEAQTDQSVTLQNFDGSEQTVLFSAKITPNVDLNYIPIIFAQVVQVPVVK